MALFIPAAIVGTLLALYNYLRFGSIFDFGHIWQLSCNNIKALHLELAALGKIPRNLAYSFYFYFLQPFTAGLTFPYLGLRWHKCWYHIDNDYYLEAVAGVLTTTPFILLILALPKLLRIYFKENKTEIIPLLHFLRVTFLFLLLLSFFCFSSPSLCSAIR
ncbi:hypothetical protein [Legionella tunisiensis]|uniref:hypothetical protein n=1 Tax=Legionella tunisiensis TaxID=1034944 RepID=UPI000368595C|nr:hypothetical protein [Legionella tunisiensis]